MPADAENENLDAWTFMNPSCNVVLRENEIRSGLNMRQETFTGRRFGPVPSVTLSWHGNAGGQEYIHNGTLNVHIWEPPTPGQNGPGNP